MSFKEFSESELAKGASNYTYYSGIPTFLRCQHDTPSNADIGIVGVPYSGGNWVERTQYLARRAERDLSMSFHRSHRALRSTLSNYVKFAISATLLYQMFWISLRNAITSIAHCVKKRSGTDTNYL